MPALLRFFRTWRKRPADRTTILPGTVLAELKRAQDDIEAALDMPREYYAQEYRPREINYWQRVPGWITALPNGIRVLDVGAAYCTLAVFTRRILGADVTVLDVVEHFRPAALLAAEGIRPVTRNIELQEIGDLGRFDLIIFTEALEHLNFKPAPTLRKLHDALAPGGTLLLSTPDAASKWGRTTKYYPTLDELPDPDPQVTWIDDHIWQYDRAELERVLREAGFAIRDLAISPGNDDFTHLNVRAVRR